MKANVTVKQALQKGRIKLVFLPLALIFVCFTISVYLHETVMIGGWVLAVGFVVGFLLAWLTWSYLVVGWKIWAYENVRNVNELKRKAIEQNLIWSDGSWFERTEIKSYEQKQKLRQLEKKFLEKDVFKDDINIPTETLVFYSKWSLVIEVCMALFVISLGFYLYYDNKSFWLAIILVAIGTYIIYDFYKKAKDRSPQIILNEHGITLKEEGFFSWNDIYNDRVFVTAGNNSVTYLAFNDIQIEINEMNISAEHAENLLHVYRVRFERNSPN